MTVPKRETAGQPIVNLWRLDRQGRQDVPSRPAPGQYSYKALVNLACQARGTPTRFPENSATRALTSKCTVRQRRKAVPRTECGEGPSNGN